MRPRKFWMFIPLAIGFFALGGYVVMLLWNYTLPNVITSVKEINYLQSLGLLVLCKILFGHFGGRGGGRWNKGQQWGGQWKQKWSTMTDEEKAKYKEEWKKRCGKD